MPKVNFYLKDPVAKSETLIYLFFSYDGQRLKYSTGQTISPKFWNEKEQTIKKSFPGSLEMNSCLEKMESDIKQIYFEGVRMKKFMNNEYLKEKLEFAFKPHGKVTKDIFFYLNEFIEVQKITKTYRTIQKYQTLVNHLRSFHSVRRFSLSFETLDTRFYEQFTAYCMSEANLMNNSIAKYIKTLKTFLHWASERGYNGNLAFKKFKAKERDADIICLSEKELFRIYEWDFSNNIALENARDIFCFGCFTGLRFSDISRITRESIKGDEIQLVSEKTTERLFVPLNQYAQAILKKHKYILPVVSIQKTNEHLKTIGYIAEVTEPITLTKFKGAEEIQIRKSKYEFLGTHTARRTFVTLSLEKGMRAEMVMSIVGHKEYATFKKYIKLTEKVKKSEMKEIWNKNESILKAI